MASVPKFSKENYTVGKCRDCDKNFFVTEAISGTTKYCEPCETVRGVLRSSFDDDYDDIKI